MDRAMLMAHISLIDGRMALPADTAYDRQLLLETITVRARRGEPVHVLVDHIHWLIRRGPSFRCTSCLQRIASTVCRRTNSGTRRYCLKCAVGQPRLSMRLLRRLPAKAVLRDVQAHRRYGEQWSAWTRWPQATPAEIIDDMRLQKRFAPVLVWSCAEIRRPADTQSRAA